MEVLGTDPAHGDQQRRARVGVVLQSRRDHGKWRVRERVAHLGSYCACYSTELVRRPWDADALLAAVGLTDHANKEIRKLSGGQRRRLDVAIGIVGRPELLFLDEPTAGFDPQALREFHKLVHSLAQEDETTIVLTTHDLDEAEKLADRIMILGGGRIIADGSAAELAQRIVGHEVRWIRDGQRFAASTDTSTKFVFGLFERYGEAIVDLEVRRASLEDTYLSLVHEAESSQSQAAETNNVEEVSQ